jgi:hypothetical protein
MMPRNCVACCWQNSQPKWRTSDKTMDCLAQSCPTRTVCPSGEVSRIASIVFESKAIVLRVCSMPVASCVDNQYFVSGYETDAGA